MNCRAVLFDLDGVLVKSEEAWFRCVEEAGRRFRGRAVTREEFQPTFGQGTQADVELFGFSCTAAELNRFYVEAFLAFSVEPHRVWVNPDAAPVLEALTGLGLKLALVTNSVTPIAESLLDVAGLRRHFLHLACADQVPRSKPAPDLVVHACRLLGVLPEESWLVGDSRYDREAAAAAGAHFAGLELPGESTLRRLTELPPLVLAAGSCLP